MEPKERSAGNPIIGAKKPELPRYGTTKACPKCGYCDMRRNEDGEIVSLHTWTADAWDKPLKGPEQIHRRCTNCGFTFKETPLDAE